jgi:uncharacterized membrane protein
MIAIIQLLAILVVPLLILKLRRLRFFKFIGTIGAAYLIGMIAAVGVFFINRAGVSLELNADVSEISSFASIGVAIPLLLFHTNISEVKKLSKKVLISFGVLTISVLIVTFITFFAYGKTVQDGAILSSMAVGLYTGGTPNLNAIGKIFGLNNTAIGIANLSDMLIGGVFYLFLLTACKPLLKRWLGESDGREIYYAKGSAAIPEGVRNSRKPIVRNVLISFGIAVIGAGIGVLIWALRGAASGTMNDFLIPALMFTATVLGVACSFHRKISAVKESDDVGQYLILVFSFALAMSINLENVRENFLSVLLLYGIITLGTFAVHMLLSKVARTDIDCAMTTMTAGIYGPAFVPAITNQIKNEALTAPGLICGSIGYAIGTFLGMGVGAVLLQF